MAKKDCFICSKADAENIPIHTEVLGKSIQNAIECLSGLTISKQLCEHLTICIECELSVLQAKILKEKVLKAYFKNIEDSATSSESSCVQGILKHAKSKTADNEDYLTLENRPKRLQNSSLNKSETNTCHENSTKCNMVNLPENGDKIIDYDAQSSLSESNIKKENEYLTNQNVSSNTVTPEDMQVDSLISDEHFKMSSTPLFELKKLKTKTNKTNSVAMKVKMKKKKPKKKSTSFLKLSQPNESTDSDVFIENALKRYIYHSNSIKPSDTNKSYNESEKHEEQNFNQYSTMDEMGDPSKKILSESLATDGLESENLLKEDMQSVCDSESFKVLPIEGNILNNGKNATSKKRKRIKLVTENSSIDKKIKSNINIVKNLTKANRSVDRNENHRNVDVNETEQEITLGQETPQENSRDRIETKFNKKKIKTLVLNQKKQTDRSPEKSDLGRSESLNETHLLSTPEFSFNKYNSYDKTNTSASTETIILSNNRTRNGSKLKKSFLLQENKSKNLSNSMIKLQTTMSVEKIFTASYDAIIDFLEPKVPNSLENSYNGQLMCDVNNYLTNEINTLEPSKFYKELTHTDNPIDNEVKTVTTIQRKKPTIEILKGKFLSKKMVKNINKQANKTLTPKKNSFGQENKSPTRLDTENEGCTKSEVQNETYKLTDNKGKTEISPNLNRSKEYNNDNRVNFTKLNESSKNVVGNTKSHPTYNSMEVTNIGGTEEHENELPKLQGDSDLNGSARNMLSEHNTSDSVDCKEFVEAELLDSVNLPIQQKIEKPNLMNKITSKTISPKDIQCRRLNTLLKADWHFTCELCSYHNMCEKSFKKHLTDEHDIESPRIFKCDKCPSAYKRHLNLQHHMVSKHGNQRSPSRQGNFICSYCDKRFTCNFNLNMHMTKHTGAPMPHACAHSGCSRTFATPAAAKLHEQRAHTSQRLHVCEYCNNSYALIYDLRTHMRWCSGLNELLECGNCGKSFRIRQKYEAHVFDEKCQSSVVDCQYAECNKRFNNTFAMWRHMHRTHNISRPAKEETRDTE